MRIEFIEQNEIHHLVYMPHQSAQELEENLRLFKESVLLRSVIKLAESNQIGEALPNMQNLDFSNLTLQQKQELEALLGKFPDLLKEEEYIYKVEMFREFLPELIQALKQLENTEETNDFIDSIELLGQMLAQPRQLSEQDQDDLSDAWESILFFVKKKLNIFEYMEGRV